MNRDECISIQEFEARVEEFFPGFKFLTSQFDKTIWPRYNAEYIIVLVKEDRFLYLMWDYDLDLENIEINLIELRPISDITSSVYVWKLIQDLILDTDLDAEVRLNLSKSVKTYLDNYYLTRLSLRGWPLSSLEIHWLKYLSDLITRLEQEI